MFREFYELIVHPDTFFARVSREKVNLIPPLVIIGAGTLFVLLGLLIPLSLVLSTNSDHLHNLAFFALIKNYLLCNATIPLITWGVLSLGSHSISRIFDGNGTLATSIQNIGYGMVPWAISTIGSAISGVIIFSVFHSWPTPSDMTWATVSNWISLLLSLIILFWGWYLWILAVMYTHGFTFRKSIVVVIVPAMIVVWLTIPVQAWIETIRLAISGT